jgi:uncharacterized membrane protein YccC
MTKGQAITAGSFAVAGFTIFILTVTLSIPHVDDAAVWRGAANIMVIVCTMIALATLIIARIERSRTVVYADRKSLEPFLPKQEALPRYDTTEVKRAKAYAYVDQQERRILRRRSSGSR